MRRLGTPDELYEQPANAFIGDPVGSNDWACAPTAAPRPPS